MDEKKEWTDPICPHCGEELGGLIEAEEGSRYRLVGLREDGEALEWDREWYDDNEPPTVRYFCPGGDLRQRKGGVGSPDG